MVPSVFEKSFQFVFGLIPIFWILFIIPCDNSIEVDSPRDSSSSVFIDSSRPSDTGMSTRSALIQTMACRLMGAKPLSELMLVYCELGPEGQNQEQNTVKFKINKQ